MKKTKNYAMPYPEQDDYFNVEDFQDMMVSVDNLMKKLSDSGAQISSDAEHLYNQTKAQMDNIQKRMNAFTALRDGSTTGDAELKDIRVAYDGKEYGNAGEAVREQASDIHKALFGAGASIWSKAKSESTKYVAETKGICILNERFTAAGVVAKISRGTFAQNESTLNLDRECSAYIVEFEKNPGTVYMPSAETIKIVSTTKIIFEANGNARCWIPVEKGQYLAVDSTATAYTSESNHVPYMLYDQANKTLEFRGFGSAGSIEPVAPYSLALEYKLEYDMDDTGLVKQIDANREAAASLKEDLEGIAKKHVNLLENLQFYPGEFYTYESHNVSENSDFGRFELFNINANENYYFIDIFSSFSCVKYDDGSYSRIENTTTGFVSGIFKPTQNGVVAITGVRSSSSKNTLFTSSKEMYENKIYESYLSFSEKASDEVRKIMDYLPKTYYVEKDESGDFVKLSDAIVTATKYMDSVVYLGDGTWDLIEEFGSDFFNNATGGGAPRSPVRGLLLKNRIHIIGSSKSKIICNYTGDNAVIKKWFSVFNSDIYGFTLENITIEASNIRYIIHDERDSGTDSYINRYINCHFKFDNSDNDTPGRTAQCIGGGLGIDGYIDINGGVFESIDTTKTGHICVVSYHNSAGANAKNHISIKNTYLKALGYFRINSYGESTEITECEITNCSMGRSVLIGHETGGSNMNINVTQWNNEIR